MAVSVTTNVKLIFDVDTNETYVQDLTSWPSVTPNGIPTPLNQVLNMKGLGTLFNPTGGVVFSALNPLSPLINLAIGNTQSADYALPVSSSEIVNGSYPFSYTARGTYSSADITIYSGGANGLLVLNDNNLSAQLLQAGDIVVLSGNTIIPNGNYTVVSTEYDGAYSNLTLSKNGVQPDLTDADGDATYSFTRDYLTTANPIYTGCTKVKPAINFISRPYNGEFGSLTVTDATDYTGVQLVGGTVSLAYPDGLIPAPAIDPVVGTSVTLTEVATGTYTITLNGTVYKVQSDGLNIVYTLSGIRIKGNPANVFERVVVWRDGLCCLQSCIEEIISANYDYLKQGKASPLTSTVATLALALGEYQVAVSCGLQDEIDSAYENVTNAIKLSGCKCNCDCGCSESPVWITNSSQEGESLITGLQDQINDLQTQISNISSDYVDSVTGLNTDNTDPQNPIIKISVDSFSIVGQGTPASPLIARNLALSPPLSGQTDARAALSDLYNLTDDLQSQIDDLGNPVGLVTGLNTDNTNPQLPIIKISLDNFTIVGEGTPAVPLVARNLMLVPAIAGQLDARGAFEDLYVLTDSLQSQIDDLGSPVGSVTGLNTDNTNPQAPIIKISVDNTTITGEGTPALPLSIKIQKSEYSANLVAIGTNNPTMTVHNDGTNNFLGNIVWTRIADGTYQGVLSNAFDAGRTNIMVSSNQSSLITAPVIYQGYWISDSQVVVRCIWWNGTGWTTAGPNFECSIKIEVYK